MTSWAQSSLLCEPGVSPGQGKLGTHRNKIGASEVPNDSCGCADAHVANDGEKPPAEEHKQQEDRAEVVIQLGDATRHVKQWPMVSHRREVPRAATRRTQTPRGAGCRAAGSLLGR